MHLQALFSLVWGQAGQKNKRHKHDVVSFEAGDITMAIRSNKQVIFSLAHNQCPGRFLGIIGQNPSVFQA